MRSMRMAALAVAITLMFSGLALARDHDITRINGQTVDHHDKQVRLRSRRITSMTTRRPISTGSRITRPRTPNVTIATECGTYRQHDGSLSTMIHGLQPLSQWRVWLSRQRWLSAIPAAAMAILAVATAIPAAGMAIPAQSMAAPATAGTQATVRLSGWQLHGPQGQVREQARSIPILAMSIGNPDSRLQQFVRRQELLPRLSTAVVIVRLPGQLSRRQRGWGY